MLLKHRKRRLCFLVENGREPPGGQFNMMPLQSFDLGIEGRDMFGSIVIGKLGKAQLFQHRCSFFGASFLRVEGNNAPGDQILTFKQT